MQVSSDSYLILTGVNDMGGGEEVPRSERNKKKTQSTHSCTRQAGGVAGVRGLTVLMWVLLIGQVTLQASVSEGVAAPGRRTSAAARGQTGATA